MQRRIGIELFSGDPIGEIVAGFFRGERNFEVLTIKMRVGKSYRLESTPYEKTV
jgi:hypothetical protein